FSRFPDSSELIAQAFVRAAQADRPTLSQSASTLARPGDATAPLGTATTWRGPRIPGYEMLDHLGSGGMGIVYRERQLRLNRLVAIKLIRPDVVPGERALARFTREAEAAARLRHPHVIQIHEIGDNEGQPFAVLELIEGTTLAKVVKAGALPIRDAAALVE